MALSDKLKKAREQKGYSQGFVAEKLNISRQAISKWENGWSSPDLDNLVILSELYEISIDELLKNSEENEYIAYESAKKVETIIALENKEKKSISTETLFFVMLTIVSCILPPIGIIVSVWIFIKNRRQQDKERLITIICIICFIVSIFNVLITVNNIFLHVGQGTAQLL